MLNELLLITAILTINGQTVLLHPIIGMFCVLPLTTDEYHVGDPLHTRRSGFAASKGQSSVDIAC